MVNGPLAIHIGLDPTSPEADMKTLMIIMLATVTLTGVAGCKLKVEPPSPNPERHYGP